tara:strand:- start:238 stop:867 length:630 start_codon:yes stop_codon:yes gene_type:complete
MGALTFAKGALGAMGAAEQAKARNKARRQNYEHMLRVRKQKWYQGLSVWGAQRNKYYQDIDENDIAAQRGYSQAQVQVNKAYEAAMQGSEASLIKHLQGSGKLAAAGRTGRSIQRQATLNLGALHRESGRRFYALTQTKEAFKSNVENIRLQQINARNRIFANAMFAPVPDLAPPEPLYENQSPNRGLLLAGLGALTGGLNVYNQYATR